MIKIKYALIGFGGIAENRIAKEGFACDVNRFIPLRHAELTGAFDLNPDRESAAKALGLKWYKNVDDILNDPKIDAVYIATNNLTHAALAIKALEHGKHVISEKPMATDIKDAEVMVKTAAKKQLCLAVDHMMIYNGYTQKAKEVIKKNKIGAVNDCCFHMEFAYGYDPAEAKTWRCNNVAEMGGPIGDVASHCFYLAEYMFDSKIVELAAVYLPKLMSIKAEDGAYIKFKLASGLAGSAKVAFSELRGGLSGTLTNLGYEIYGSEATLRSYGAMFQLSGTKDEPIKIRLEQDKLGRVRDLVPKHTKNIYQSLIENHAKSIQDGKFINAEDGLHNLKLCAAAHESAQNNGKIVKVK